TLTWVSSAFGDSTEDAPRRPLADLVVQYQRVANAPKRLSPPTHWGSARGADVLLFVLETLPAYALPLGSELNQFSAIRRLRDRSWVATKHFTTYPTSDRALYSLMTSQYPPQTNA